MTFWALAEALLHNPKRRQGALEHYANALVCSTRFPATWGILSSPRVCHQYKIQSRGQELARQTPTLLIVSRPATATLETMRFTDDIFLPCCQRCPDSGALLGPNGNELTVDEEGNYYADIPADTPDIENVDFYAAAVSTVFCSCRTRLDAAGDYVLVAHHIATNPTEAVSERVQQGDATSTLELAMRYVDPSIRCQMALTPTGDLGTAAAARPRSGLTRRLSS